MEYIDTAKLFPSKGIDMEKESVLKGIIKLNNNLKFHPLIVDSKTFVVFDGHHRLYASKMLGIDKVPVNFIEYSNNNIYSKDKVNIIKRALSGKILKV